MRWPSTWREVAELMADLQDLTAKQTIGRATAMASDERFQRLPPRKPVYHDVVAIALRSRGHTDVPQDTIDALAKAADGLPTADAIDALEDALRGYEQTHPVHPDWMRQRRAERIAAHESKQAAEASERRARKRNLRAAK